MDGNFQPHARQDQGYLPLEDIALSDVQRQRCLQVGRLIGRAFHFSRIDLLIGNDGGLHLNEVTLAPGAGLPLEDRQLDRRLGKLWPGREFFNFEGPPSRSGASLTPP